MRRLAKSILIDWKTRKRRKPLVIRGARQVGKSTLVRQFALESDLELVEINLERNPELDAVFKTLDIEKIIEELQGLANTRIESGKVLLFFDEIQATPHALAALRYFYEDRPDLHVIAAGSLLEFALQEHSFSMRWKRLLKLPILSVRAYFGKSSL